MAGVQAAAKPLTIADLEAAETVDLAHLGFGIRPAGASRRHYLTNRTDLSLPPKEVVLLLYNLNTGAVAGRIWFRPEACELLSFLGEAPEFQHELEMWQHSENNELKRAFLIEAHQHLVSNQPQNVKAGIWLEDHDDQKLINIYEAVGYQVVFADGETMIMLLSGREIRSRYAENEFSLDIPAHPRQEINSSSSIWT